MVSVSHGNLRPMPRARFWHHRIGFVVLLVATALALALTACGTTSTGQGAATTPTATLSGTSGASVQVYFAKHPDTDNNPTAVFAVTRATPSSAATTQERATFALEQLLQGPTQAERAQGYYSPFDGQLALQSVCSEPFHDFELTFDHRGPMMEQGTAMFQFCRRVDIPGDLDGPRMSTMITTTLMQFAPIKRVVILNYMGACFDDLQGINACLNGTQEQPAGYPIKVYFSKHPDSDNSFTAVFPVARTAPDLGVATFAVKQLIAGPTAAETHAGYFTELSAAINRSDPSSCGGADFTISLNMRGRTPQPGTATLQFCRTLMLPGEGADARIGTELQATLTQFPTIKKAVILTKQGNCFGDLSGQNLCLTAP